MYPLPLSPALHRLRSESMPRKELLARPADVPPVADHARCAGEALEHHRPVAFCDDAPVEQHHRPRVALAPEDRKSTRLNSSHGYISYAVFCLKKKKK